MKTFKNTDKAIKRLLLAKKRNEKIGIWGDYDPDGIPGAVIIREALIGAGFPARNLTVILPRVKKYNRSFNPVHLKFLKKKGVSLILGVDFGTSDFDQVRMAKKMGFDVILLDHHPQRPGKLPAILINPLQKGDRYPHKNWCGAGVAYKFFEAYYLDRDLDFKILERNLDLLALAMIADRIKIDNYNVKYIDRGIQLINKHARPGLKALLHLANGERISRDDIMLVFIYRFFPRVSNEENEMYRLFQAKTEKQAFKYAKILNDRHKLIQKYIKEAIQKGMAKYKSGDAKALVIKVKIPSIASGMVAAISEGLVEKIKIPTFVYKKQGAYFQGSSRAPFGSSFNLVKAMDSCKDLLVSYGGHPTASGFRLKKGKEKEFEKAILKYFNNYESKK
jgi:single-stranded-DNA-specific exonuclease